MKRNFSESKVKAVAGRPIMENDDRKIFETTFACFGIHVGLSLLLTVCLTAYDGLQHTMSLAISYMEFGWVIPFAFWFKVRDLIRRPASPKRIATNKLTPAITLIVLGPLFFLVGVFMPKPDKLTINREVILPSDPRFAHDASMFTILFAIAGLVFTAVGNFWFRKGRNN